MNTTEINKVLSAHYGDVRRAVANVLRASRYMGNDAVLDDVTQDAMVYLAETALVKYDAERGASVKTFVCTVAANVARNWRKNVRQSTAANVSVMNDTPAADSDGGTAPTGAFVVPVAVDGAARMNSALRLRDALAMLSDSDRTFILAILDGAQAADFGDYETVRCEVVRRKKRILKRLRALLAE